MDQGLTEAILCAGLIFTRRRRHILTKSTLSDFVVSGSTTLTGAIRGFFFKFCRYVFFYHFLTIGQRKASTILYCFDMRDLADLSIQIVFPVDFHFFVIREANLFPLERLHDVVNCGADLGLVTRKQAQDHIQQVENVLKHFVFSLFVWPHCLTNIYTNWIGEISR